MPRTRAPGSRRRPHPYDLYVGSDVRVMLEPQADGNLVSQKSKTLDATAPVDYTYGSANPFKERSFEWSELFGGFGQAVAPNSVPRRFSHCIRVDTSIDGLWMKGPRFEDHIETIHASAGEVRQFIQAMHGGTLTLFAICENGVYRRVSDGTWAASLTAGTSPALAVGTKPQRALRFTHRGATPVDALYLATNNTNLWQYNGTAWALCALAAGPGTGVTQGEARYLERVGDEMWVAGDYWIVKVEDDPMDRTKYAGVIYIGDRTHKITWLAQIENTLYVFKEDGLYTVSDTGVDEDLFPTLRGKPDPENGRNAAVWVNKLWIPFGDQTFFINETAQLVPDGLEQMLENTSEVRGRMVAGAGHNTWFFYEVYYSSDNDTSYLVKHGTWVEESTESGLGVAEFADAHHGALALWDKKATSCDVIPSIHAGGNDRLYVGFLDGTTQWCVLPQNGLSPIRDSNCEFTGLDSYVYLPLHHSNYRSDNKLYKGITAMGPTLTNTEWAEVEYRIDYTNPTAVWTLLDPDDPRFILPNTRKSFPSDPAVYGRAIQVRVKLVKDASTAASPKNLSPVVEGVAIHEQIRPSVSLEYVMSIKCGSRLPRHNGTVDRRRGQQIRDAVLAKCAEVGSVIFRMPTGELEEMTIIDYRESAASFQKRFDYEYLVQVTVIQLRTISHERVFSGLTYSTLEGYTLGQLESII